MITVEEAQQLVLGHTSRMKAVTKKLSSSNGAILAEPVVSPIESPPFAQSSMDGYAIRFEDMATHPEFVVRGEHQAGFSSSHSLQSGETFRIFTGAPLPAGADTIVMQEITSVSDGRMKIMNPSAVHAGLFVRLKGQQIHKGDTALSKGHFLSPASIGYIASLGLDSVKIYDKPDIGIITTGNELQKPGKKLKEAAIYESNSYMLQALLQEMHFPKSNVTHIEDQEKKLVDGFKKVLHRHDVLIITGGVSVGDYDFVVPALKKLHVKEIFHHVAQKPGRPFFFGTKKDKLIFALPGNPASVLVCFYQYIYPALRKMSGHLSYALPIVEKKIMNPYIKKPGLTHFLKGLATDQHVEILQGQESFVLASFAKANCLISIPRESEGVRENEIVSVQYIHSI